MMTQRDREEKLSGLAEYVEGVEARFFPLGRLSGDVNSFLNMAGTVLAVLKRSIGFSKIVQECERSEPLTP